MRILRRLLHASLIVLMLVVGAAAAAIVVSQTAWFRDWLRGYIVREANLYLNGQLSIQRLGGNLFFGIEMENIAISMDGTQVVAIKDLGLNYSVFEMISKGISIDKLRLNKPTLYLQREGETWSISRLVKKQAQEADRRGPERPISVGSIGISDGSLVIDGPAGVSGVEVPKRIDRLDAKLAFKYEPVHYSIDITHVSFRGSDPSLALNALSGGIAIKDDDLFVQKLSIRTAESSVSIEGAIQNYLAKPVFNIKISSDKLSLPEMARVVPALAGVRLQPMFELRVGGPMDQLGVEMNVRSDAGLLTGKLTADLTAPGQSVAGDVSIRHLNLEPITNEPSQKSDITADARVDLRSTSSLSDLNSLRGTVHVDAPHVKYAGYAAEQIKADASVQGRQVKIDGRAAAYGARATTAGRVVIPESSEPLGYDLRGRLRSIDLQRIPRSLKVPPAPTNVNADYHATGSIVAGSPKGGRHAQSASSRTNADITFLDSTVADARIQSGSKASVAVNGEHIGYQADVTVSDVDLQKIGQAFNVKALAVERYRSSLNGHIVASGQGTKPEEMNATASGNLTDSSLMGGKVPSLMFEASVAENTAHIKATGEATGFDPGELSGKPAMNGTVGGRLDVDATLRNVSAGVTAESVDATARIDMQPSTIGGLSISSASVDADYHDSVATIRTFDVKGRDLNASATGTLALNETGQSNLTIHADTPSLEEIGKLVDKPLMGLAKLDGTVTGNKAELQSTGDLTASDVAYGSVGALTLSSNYTVKLPDLDAERAEVNADTSGTFVTIGGQHINELHAKAHYNNKQVDFDATAKQPQRSAGAAGSLVIHPDHQEVHLQQLSLEAQNITWALAPGSQATIQYGNDVVTVNQVELVSGDQKISADGTFGRPDESLNVSLANVDMAAIDTLLLRPPQFSGRLSATAAVSGSTESPAVNGEFQINQGGFRQFHYDAFNGKVEYSGKGIDLDARLDQNPTTWITAKGYLPVALFSGAESSGHRETFPPEERIDIHVDSSPIDFGIVQGFTTALTNVTGKMQAKIDVTGSAGDPHPAGAITVENAAFTVEPTGVNYTELDGRIDLQPDRVHIAEIKLLDNQRKPLTLSGDLAIHELQVGGVDVALKADDFKVIDNKMGNVRINTDLHLAGEIAQPRVEGELGVSTGVVNLDRILDAVGETAYATTAAGDPKTPEQATPTPASASQSSLMDALQVDVHVTVPNDLVIKAQDLQTSAAPIGLGSLNLTLGGDLYVSKVPYDQIRFTGTVNTVRGFYDFQSRRFDILRDGKVRFEGLDQIDPALDLVTERVIQAVTARVAVRGTLRQPEIELSSVPPLEEADILALIVFNQPLNQLGEGQQVSLAQRAQALATGAAAGQLSRSVEKLLNVNTFEINTAPDSGATAQLTVGQQIGQNLYVKLVQGIGDQSQTNFITEYELSKWLRFRANVLQGSTTQQQLFQRAQGSGVDMLFLFSY